MFGDLVKEQCSVFIKGILRRNVECFQRYHNCIMEIQICFLGTDHYLMSNSLFVNVYVRFVISDWKFYFNFQSRTFFLNFIAIRENCPM